MTIDSFKSIVAKKGGYECIALMYFDNGKTFKRNVKDFATFKDQFTLDEECGLMIERQEQTGLYLSEGNRRIPPIHVIDCESMDSMTGIIFAEKPEQVQYIDFTL